MKTMTNAIVFRTCIETSSVSLRVAKCLRVCNILIRIASARKAQSGSRIVQYKMSMKRGQGGERFPMQDEHEKGKNGVGVARPDASANDECREPEPGTDPGVSQVEPADRVCGVPTKGEVRLGGARA